MYNYISLGQELVTNRTVPVTYFVNHVIQLSLLTENLSKFKKASVVGTSGIGKTQLVRMYVEENKTKYDIIWFFDTSIDIDTEFVRLAKKINELSGRNVIKEDELVAKQEVSRYLTETGNKWLLVFDNLRAKQNKKILDLIEWEANGHLIFCSQDSEFLPNVIKMEKFNKQHSIELMDKILTYKDNNVKEFLAEEFKGYPVLMVQGAQLLNNIPGLDKQIYINKVFEAADKIKFNIELALEALTPSAKSLLNKIVLINTQGFSKKLVSIISDNKVKLDEDLYQLSKFALITNLETVDDNPVFEMHDVIALKILELISSNDKKKNIEIIVDRIMKAMPEGVHDGHIFRTSKAVHENLEIIILNVKKFHPSVYILLELNLLLLTDYINTLNYDKAGSLINWFNEKKKEGAFSLNNMSVYQKYIYSRYLGAVGGYYRLKMQEQFKAIEYFEEAKRILEAIEGYNNIKSNTIYQLALSLIATGDIEAASVNINIIEAMLNNGLVEKSESGLVHLAKAKLLTAQGDFENALMEVNQDINKSLKYGLKEDDLLFSSTYLLKAEILNFLQRYDEAIKQAEFLYNMHGFDPTDTSVFLSRIYTQMAKSYAGLQNFNKAIKYSTIAVNIVAQNIDTELLRNSTDIEIAKTYVVYADIISKKKPSEEAISYYEIAEGIYQNAYKNHAKKMNDIIYTVYTGGKLACNQKNDFWARHFYNSLKTLVGSGDDKLRDLEKSCNKSF